jgi:hypothetical protein
MAAKVRARFLGDFAAQLRDRARSRAFDEGGKRLDSSLGDSISEIFATTWRAVRVLRSPTKVRANFK